jgi:hypothetical protein
VMRSMRNDFDRHNFSNFSLCVHRGDFEKRNRIKNLSLPYLPENSESALLALDVERPKVLLW